MSHGRFLYDLLALTPLDFLYFKFGLQYVILRLPRLLKYRFLSLIPRFLHAFHVHFLHPSSSLLFIFLLRSILFCSIRPSWFFPISQHSTTTLYRMNEKEGEKAKRQQQRVRVVESMMHSVLCFLY